MGNFTRSLFLAGRIGRPTILVMNARRRLAWIVFALSFGATLYAQEPAQDFFHPWIRYWRPALSGNFLVTRGSIPGSGTNIGIGEDLGIRSLDSVELGFDVVLDEQRFRLDYVPLNMSGTKTLTENLIYHNVLFPAGETVSTHLNVYYAALSYDSLVYRSDSLSFRLGVQADVWNFNGKLEGISPLVLNESRGLRQVLPGINASVASSVGDWTFSARSSFAAIQNHEIWDMEAQAALALSKKVDLGIGYRRIRFDLGEGTNKFDVVAGGPFVGLTLRF